MSTQAPAPDPHRPKAKIYDRPERKGLSPTLLAVLLLLLMIVIALIAIVVRHR